MSNESGALMTAFEAKHDIWSVQSEAKGLFYLQDNERDKIGIMSIVKGRKQFVILTKKQAEALIKEFKDICEIYFSL